MGLKCVHSEIVNPFHKAIRERVWYTIYSFCLHQSREDNELFMELKNIYEQRR